jgi:acetyl esterase/lipase
MISSGLFTPVDWSDCSVSVMQIPVRDGTSIRAVQYGRIDGEASVPLVVYFHGGGMVFGSPEAGEKYFEVLVKELRLRVVGVGYRLAPEVRDVCMRSHGMCAKVV